MIHRHYRNIKSYSLVYPLTKIHFWLASGFWTWSCERFHCCACNLLFTFPLAFKAKFLKFPSRSPLRCWWSKYAQTCITNFGLENLSKNISMGCHHFVGSWICSCRRMSKLRFIWITWSKYWLVLYCYSLQFGIISSYNSWQNILGSMMGSINAKFLPFLISLMISFITGFTSNTSTASGTFYK